MLMTMYSAYFSIILRAKRARGAPLAENVLSANCTERRANNSIFQAVRVPAFSTTD